MKTGDGKVEKRGNQKGLSLIEIAIALLVLGLIMTPLLAIYNAERAQEVINDTRSDFASIEAAIENYVNTNERYPLPASLIQVEGDAQYGKAFDPDGNNIMPGNCPGALATDGLCMIVEAPNGSALPADEQLLIGMVPFGDIKIEEEDAYDAWGRRILYVVTARQTQNPATSTFAGGTYVRSAPHGIQFSALNTFTQNPIPLVPEAGITDGYTDFDMLLVSTGPSGKGGFGAAGVMVDVCIDSANPELEDENCDFTDNMFMIDTNKRPDPRTELAGGTVNNIASSQYANGTRSLQPGSNFYDDLTHELKEVSADIWNENYETPSTIVTSANRLGIGEQEPQTVLHVSGDLRADDDPATGVVEGRVVAAEIDDISGANNMSPALIGGEVAQMNCYQDALGDRPRVVVGVGNRRTFCAQTTDSAGNGNMAQDTGTGPTFPGFRLDTGVVNSYDCNSLNSGPTTYRMTGIDAAGVVQCAPIP